MSPMRSSTHPRPTSRPEEGRLPTFLVVLGLSLAALGCGESPVAFVDRRPMEPLTIYSDWFRQVARCMEREEEATPERFGKIRWFSAEEIRDDRLGPHQKIWGNWISPHEITIRSDALFDRLTVTHEIVHDLLQGTGHDSPAFELCTGSAASPGSS